MFVHLYPMNISLHRAVPARRNYAGQKKKIERCFHFKFIVKLGKSTMESFRLLTDICEDAVTSRSRAFERHRQFIKCRYHVDDEQRVGCPCFSKTDENK